MDLEKLETMKRKDLQKLCKDVGVKANSKTEILIRDLREYYQSIESKQDDSIDPHTITENAVHMQEEQGDTKEDDGNVVTNSSNVGMAVATQEICEETAACDDLNSAEQVVEEVMESASQVVEKALIGGDNTADSDMLDVESEICEVKSEVVEAEAQAPTSESPELTTSVECEVINHVTEPLTCSETTQISDADDDRRRQAVLASRKASRAKEVSKHKETKKAKLSVSHNKVAGTLRPTPKLKPTVENAAKKEVTEKAKEKQRKPKIDFDKLHERQFKKMESIDEYQKKQNALTAASALLFGTSTKPTLIPKPASFVVPAPKTPSVAKVAPKTPKSTLSADNTKAKTNVRLSTPRPDSTKPGTPTTKPSTKSTITSVKKDAPVDTKSTVGKPKPQSDSAVPIISVVPPSTEKSAKKLTYAPHSGPLPKLEIFSSFAAVTTPKRKIPYDPKKSISAAKQKKVTAKSENGNPNVDAAAVVV